MVGVVETDPLTFDAVATHVPSRHADSITQVSFPPGALSYGWPFGLVCEPNSTAKVPVRRPGGGALSSPVTARRIVAMAAISMMIPMGITTALRRHQGHGWAVAASETAGSCSSSPGRACVAAQAF